MENIRRDLRQVKDHWDSLDPTVKLLDIITLVFITLFGVSFFYVYIFEVRLIVTNAAFMIYPALLAGYVYIYRSKLANPESDKKQARKEFLTSVSIITILILSSFLYYLLLE